MPTNLWLLTWKISEVTVTLLDARLCLVEARYVIPR